MADQRSAVAPGESLSADLIAQTGFSSSRRGYEVKEVRDFLARIAGEVRELHRRIEAAEAAQRDAEERARHPRIDEETLAGAVGEETAAILRTARTAAAEIRTKAEEQATARLREAHAQADALRAEAETTAARRTKEAEEAAEAMRASALADAERTRSVAREEAELMRQQADHERRLTIESAQAIREKILSDLARRRRLATVQVDQLRAGRQRLLEAYALVRRNLDEVTDELQRAEAEARAAAEAVEVRAVPGAKDDLSEEDLATLRSTWPPAPPPATLPPQSLSSPTPPPAAPAAPPSGSAPLAPPAPERPASEAATVAPASPEPGEVDEAIEPTGVHPVLDLTDPRAPVAERTVSEAPPASSAAEPASPELRPEASNGHPVEESSEPSLASSASPARLPDADADASDQPAAVSEPTATHQPVAAEPVVAPAPVEEPVTAPNAVLRLDEEDNAGAVTEEGPWVERVTDNDSVRIIRGGTVTATPRSGRSRSRRSGPGGQPGPFRRPAGDGPPPPEEEPASGEADAGEGAAGDRAGEGGAAEGRNGEGGTGGEAAPPRPGQLVTNGEPSPDEAGDPSPQEAGEAAAGAPAGSRPAPADVVGGLFARIRAGQPQPPEAAATRATDGEQAPSDAVAEEQGDAGVVLDGDELLLQRRDEAVADVEVALSRRLKRVLQDEQNDLLDRLRSVRGTPKASAVLPALDVQRSALVDAGRRFLDQAAAAGVRFGRAMVPAEAPTGDDEVPPVDDLAEEMADLIARPLRRRLEQAFADNAGDDQAVLVDALGSTYREWKTHRIEQLAGDAVAASFSRGSLEAVPEGTPLRWLVEDDDGPCPDCDDNALAGSLLRGELFPTGQACPPAHAGCRCLLVTANDES
jgi:DivIVA domain-containing protein